MVPKWTAYKRDQVIRKYGPWMDFWMLKGIRKIPVHKTWTKYIVERDWYQAPRGTRGPAGVRNCLQLCRDLQPGQKVPGFNREEATPGGMDIRPVSREEMGEEALGLLAAQGSQERAEGKLMIDENC